MARSVVLISEAPIATVQILSHLLQYVETEYGIHFVSRVGSGLDGSTLIPGAFPLVVRSCDAGTLAATRILRRHGLAYGYYLDDNFWELDPDSSIGKHYASPPVRRALEEIIAHAEVVIAATPLLAEYVRAYAGHVVHLNVPVDLTLVPSLRPVRAGALRMGFAGSVHRSQDLEEVAGAVHRALERHPRLEVEVIGARGGLGAHPRIREFAHVDSYREYVALQLSREWSFALAPLGAARSNAYKTDNKYREYGALGIPGIYEDAPPYAAVRDAETGLLAGSRRTWDDAIETLIASPDLRVAIRRAAREDIELRYAPDVVAREWGSLLRELPAWDEHPARLARAQHDLASRPSRFALRVARLRDLGALGRHVWRVEGPMAAVTRTARFASKRLGVRGEEGR